MIDFFADFPPTEAPVSVPGFTLTECEKCVVNAIKMVDSQQYAEAREEIMKGMMTDIQCVSALLMMRFLRIDHPEIFGETDITSVEMLSRAQKAPAEARERAKKMCEYLSKSLPESPTALFLCGSLAEKVFNSLPDAITYYKASGQRGFAAAQFNVGCFYNCGIGVDVDKAEAAKWFQLAADQGRLNAANNLGVLYLTGQGVPMDRKKAAELFKAAAKSGHAGAKQNYMLAMKPQLNIKLPTSSAAAAVPESPVESPREEGEPWNPAGDGSEDVPLTNAGRTRKRRRSFSSRFFGGGK